MDARQAVPDLLIGKARSFSEKLRNAPVVPTKRFHFLNYQAKNFEKFGSLQLLMRLLMNILTLFMKLCTGEILS